MNKLFIALAASLTLGIASPVPADAQTTDKAAPDKAAPPAPPREATSPASEPRCRVEPLVLPLDHGPRAQSTPYLNRLRIERHEAQVKACTGGPK